MTEILRLFLQKSLFWMSDGILNRPLPWYILSMLKESF